MPQISPINGSTKLSDDSPPPCPGTVAQAQGAAGAADDWLDGDDEPTGFTGKHRRNNGKTHGKTIEKPPFLMGKLWEKLMGKTYGNTIEKSSFFMRKLWEFSRANCEITGAEGNWFREELTLWQ